MKPHTALHILVELVKEGRIGAVAGAFLGGFVVFPHEHRIALGFVDGYTSWLTAGAVVSGEAITALMLTAAVVGALVGAGLYRALTERGG
jgi:hypothetical protein